MLLIKVDKHWDDGKIVLELFPESKEEAENETYLGLVGKSILFEENNKMKCPSGYECPLYLTGED